MSPAPGKFRCSVRGSVQEFLQKWRGQCCHWHTGALAMVVPGMLPGAGRQFQLNSWPPGRSGVGWLMPWCHRLGQEEGAERSVIRSRE